ncbi:hypothetical protein CBS9595_002376 [Malassezia furfur]|nr:hypothetical protein CBS9595_002376 [Malassezia furfur]
MQTIPKHKETTETPSAASILPNTTAPAAGNECKEKPLAIFRVQVTQAQVPIACTDNFVFVTVRIPGINDATFRTPAIPKDQPLWAAETATFDFAVTHSWIAGDHQSEPESRSEFDESDAGKAEVKQKRTLHGRLFPRKASQYLRNSAAAGVKVVRKHRPRPLLLRRRRRQINGEKAQHPMQLALGEDQTPTALELVLWSVHPDDANEQVHCVGEVTLPVIKWANCSGGNAYWYLSEPEWLNLEPALERAALQVRLGFLTSAVDDAPQPFELDQLYHAICKAVQNNDSLSLRNIPAFQAVGMAEDDEELQDDGLSESESEYDSDEASEPEDEDMLEIEDASAQSSLEVSSEGSLSELEDNMQEVTVEEELPSRTTTRGRRRRMFLSIPRRQGRASQARQEKAVDNINQSDADDSDAPQRYWRIRRLRLHSLPTVKSVPLTGSDGEVEMRRPRKPRRLRVRKPRRAGNIAFNAAAGQDMLGLVMIEVDGARNLPHWRNMTKTSFDMDPFTIVSFNRKIFRTRVCRHTLNPVWKEKLLLHVRRNEAGFNVKFFVYDWDKMSANDYVGEATLPMSTILQSAQSPDEETGLYRSECSMPLMTHSLEIPLYREQGDEERKFGTGNTPVLVIRYGYRPYEALRQRFLREMLRFYDTNESNGVDIVEFTTMLGSLGSTLTRETIQDLFVDIGKNPETDQLTYDEALRVLEAMMKIPLSARRHEVNVSVLDNEAYESDSAPMERVIRLESCPFCNKRKLRRANEADILTHLALCASSDWRRVDELAMSRFVTASQAHRKWYTNVIKKISQGNYRVGANSANILVQDRDTGELLEEKMQVYVRLGIRLLYQGAYGQMSGARVRRMLRNMSVKQGRKFDAASSAKFIGPFIAFHGINVDEMADPVESFATFNEFFCRKIKMELRPVDDPDDARTLVSCADCRLMAFPTVDRATKLWVKGRNFSVPKLLGQRYGGASSVPLSLIIFRLAPQDYHRFHVPVDGVVGEPDWAEGEYYTVNPMGIRSTIDVFGENKRVVIPILTEEFGMVYITAIGAMMVGSILLSVTPGQRVKRGDELGYFKFGGSTLVLLAEEKLLTIDRDLVDNSESCIETLVRVGMHIGRASVPT